MEKACCEVCKFGQTKMQIPNEIRTVRTCQRFPPMPLVTPTNISFVNPAVSDHQWCGEFEQATSGEEKTFDSQVIGLTPRN